MNTTLRKLLTLLLALSLIFSVFACTPTDSDQNNNSNTNNDNTNNSDESNNESAGTATTFVTMDINPSVEITLDADGKVTSVYGANEDGQILLYGETEKIVGTDYEKAIEYITDLAIDLGYLDEETGTVSTSVMAENESLANEIQSKLSAKITSVASETGITVSINTEDPFSLLCELNELKAQYPNNAAIQGLTPSEYKLAVTLSERESISVAAAAELESGEMIERINKAHGTLEKYATDSYLKAKSEASRIFNASMGVLKDAVYSEIYTENLMNHLDTYYYGFIYQAYSTTARTYRSIYEIKTFANSMASFELDDATVEAIKTELELTDTTALQNEEGKITVESLIEFCDEFIKENEVPDDVKARIEDIVSDAKVAAELANKGTTDAYSTDIANLKTAISTTINTVNTYSAQAMLLMNDAQKAEFNACLADLAEVEATVDEIISGGITESEVDVLATEAEGKAAEYLEKIKADLSEAELKAAEAKIASIEAAQASLTADFESRLATAETQAKSYIETERNKRKAASQTE